MLHWRRKWVNEQYFEAGLHELGKTTIQFQKLEARLKRELSEVRNLLSFIN
jgi:hypothetical protein